MFYDLNFPFCPFLWSLLVTQWDCYLNPNNWCRSSLWEFTLNSKRLFTYIHSCKILFITDRVFSGFFAQTVEQLANVRTSLTYKKQYETLQLEGNSLTTSKYFKAHKMVASNKKTTNIASSPSLPAPPLPNQKSKQANQEHPWLNHFLIQNQNNLRWQAWQLTLSRKRILP